MSSFSDCNHNWPWKKRWQCPIKTVLFKAESHLICGSYRRFSYLKSVYLREFQVQPYAVKTKLTKCEHSRWNSYRLQLSQYRYHFTKSRNYLKRRYQIRHWIPMFIGTPCTICLLVFCCLQTKGYLKTLIIHNVIGTPYLTLEKILDYYFISML